MLGIFILLTMFNLGANAWFSCIGVEPGETATAGVFQYECDQTGEATILGCQLLDKNLETTLVKINGSGYSYRNNIDAFGFHQFCLEDDEKVFTKTDECYLKKSTGFRLNEIVLIPFEVGTSATVDLGKDSYDVTCFKDTDGQVKITYIRLPSKEPVPGPSENSSSPKSTTGPPSTSENTTKLPTTTPTNRSANLDIRSQKSTDFFAPSEELLSPGGEGGEGERGGEQGGEGVKGEERGEGGNGGEEEGEGGGGEQGEEQGVEEGSGGEDEAKGGIGGEAERGKQGGEGGGGRGGKEEGKRGEGGRGGGEGGQRGEGEEGRGGKEGKGGEQGERRGGEGGRRGGKEERKGGEQEGEGPVRGGGEKAGGKRGGGVDVDDGGLLKTTHSVEREPWI